VDTWTFIWLMLLLKIPIVGLLLLVRWAIMQTPDSETEPEGEGGVGPRARPRHPHPRPRLPRAPRRGPHRDDPAPTAPARVRPLVARARRAPAPVGHR